MSTRQLSYREWKETPYALSDAKDSDRAIERLLGKYRIEDYQWTRAKGPNGRRAVILRFNLRGKTYRIALETLNCPEADEADRERQVKRAVFWMLKASLEAATVFFSAEEALYAYLELPDGATMYEASRLHVEKLKPANFGELVWDPHKLLPGPKQEGQ